MTGKEAPERFWLAGCVAANARAGEVEVAKERDGYMNNDCIDFELLVRTLCHVQEDRYEPLVARYVVDAVQSVDHESATLTITLAIDAARWECGRVKRGIQPFL